MNKVYLAVDSYGTETMSDIPPIRGNVSWVILYGRAYNQIKLPTGTIRKLIGRDLTWEDEPVELREEVFNQKKTDSFSLKTDVGVFAQDILNNYDNMRDDVKKMLLMNIVKICEKETLKPE